MASITDRIKSAWNAFNGNDPVRQYVDVGPGSSFRPDRTSAMFYNGDRSIIKAISNRIAVDVASVTIEHVRLDDNGNYKETINSSLNECLNVSANIDQTGRALIQDICESMFDEGVVAIVPTDMRFKSSFGPVNPELSEGFDIETLRVAKVVEWFPRHVKVRIYNERTGRNEEIVVAKSYTAIVVNPLYSIMNEQNSTLQRLIRTFNNLDSLNNQTASGKLDLIIQLPYVVKSELRKNQANERRRMIEDQLVGSKYGIAYIDGTERITQLNRPLENNLWAQAKELEQDLYNQLGLTKDVFDGTANEATMLNYNNRTIEPVLAAITDEMKRKFLSKTARKQGQSIIYFRDPFRLVPVSQLAEIADKFTRNEILSPNEIRSEIGYKPNDDPKSDELRNRNINQGNEATMGEGAAPGMEGQQDISGEQPQEETPEDKEQTINELMAILGGE